MNKAIKTVLGGVLFVAIWIGLWNLFDLIWKTWINGSGYQFSSSYHILYPLGIGIVVYLVLFVFNTVKKKGSSLEPVGKKLQYSRKNLINL